MKNYLRTLVLLAGLLTVSACNQAPLDESLSTQGTTFNITNTSDLGDSKPGDGICASALGGCTLRAAIEETNALAGADTINLPAGTYPGLLNITDSLTILGSRNGASIIDGNNRGIVIFIGVGSENPTDFGPIRVALHFLTIQHGRRYDHYPFHWAAAGIHNYGQRVLISHCIVRENTGIDGATAIGNDTGYMEIVHSSIINNGNDGRGNSPTIVNGGHPAYLWINKSTVSGNSSVWTGAIENTGGNLLIMQNSTVSDNESFSGTGGLNNHGTAYLNNVTITNNTTHDDGDYFSSGGVQNRDARNTNIYIANSIIAGNHSENTDAHDCSGPIRSMGYNLIEDTSGCTIAGNETGNIYNADPLLGPLADNRGDTFTHALAANSPARNAGNPAPANGVGTACEATDQRFMARSGPSGRCDMGAYERGGSPGGVAGTP